MPSCRRQPPSRLAVAVLALLGVPALVRADPEPVSYRNEVTAVFAKGGCNSGACHGNLNGKGGFRLSLRGQDADFDLVSLKQDALGRRVNPLDPAGSLLLLKATGAVPHEGGRRFGRDSLEYKLLHAWIRAGMPGDERAPRLTRLTVTPPGKVLYAPEDRVRLQVRAEFADGSARDVTRLAVFEPSNIQVRVEASEVWRGEADPSAVAQAVVVVRYLSQQVAVPIAFVPDRPGFRMPDLPRANYIDQHVFAQLEKLHIAPSPLAPDEMFLRRAYLDATGLLPTPDEARAFLKETHPDKRARLIDALLARPEFAELWALKWSDLLRSEEKSLDRKGVTLFHQWIRQSIADGKPLNEFAREVIAGRGSTYASPAANFYRALRDPYSRSEAVAQVFLGVRVQCARCHNHPFDRWTQNDYHSLAAFFARVQYRVVENNRRDKLDSHEFDGEQVVWMDRVGEVKDPRTKEVLRPLLLGAPTPALPENADRLQVLADWVARPDNPFFARAQANRIWYHLMGRGLVEPNDDFRASNPPANEALLQALTDDFAGHHFDLRHLVRRVMNSRTYQLASRPNDTNREDEINCSHTLIRPLQAEALLDAVSRVLEVPVRFNGQPRGLRAGQLPGVPAFQPRGTRLTDAEKFLQLFGRPERLLTCECERSNDSTLGQAFQLISGELLNKMLGEPDNRLGRLLKEGKSNQAILEELYLAALSRLPAPAEARVLLAQVEASADRRAAWEDVVWGLLNSKSFLLRQ
jgi:uncharacterized protein DUF1549/uncharacterized protein DUF1553